MAGKYKITKVGLKTHGHVKVYAGPQISEALQVLMNLKIYEGVKVLDLIDAVYTQGLKDGARQAFAAGDSAMIAAKKEVPHRNPGRPQKR